MMNQQIASRLGTDLFLLHAPSAYNFCERDDMLFAYLSDSDGDNVTSVYANAPGSGERLNMVSWLSDDFSRCLCCHTNSGSVHCPGGGPQRSRSDMRTARGHRGRRYH